MTATYGLRDDGGINVINKGYNPDGRCGRKRKGKPISPATRRAALKVFFGPFYGGYNVIALDREYRHALVLWSGSRLPVDPFTDPTISR